MSYDITLYRREVRTLAISTRSEVFFGREATFPAFTLQQRQQLHKRLLAYNYAVTFQDETRTEYDHSDYAIQVNLFATSLVFSVSSSDRDVVFEAMQTSFELTDTREFAVYNWQQGTWAEEE